MKMSNKLWKEKNEYEELKRYMDLKLKSKKFELSKLCRDLEIERQKIENKEKV